MNYFIDESGNTGDVASANSALDFAGQPLFSLACIGVNNIDELENDIYEIKRSYNVQSSELKAGGIYKKKA